MMEWAFAMVVVVTILLIANLMVLIACLKLYTEMFKQIAQEKR